MVSFHSEFLHELSVVWETLPHTRNTAGLVFFYWTASRLRGGLVWPVWLGANANVERKQPCFFCQFLSVICVLGDDYRLFAEPCRLSLLPISRSLWAHIIIWYVIIKILCLVFDILNKWWPWRLKIVTLYKLKSKAGSTQHLKKT